MGKTVGDVPSFSYFIMLSIVQDHGRHLVFRTLILGSGIPEWFNHQKEEDIEFMDLPGVREIKLFIYTSSGWNNSNFLGFALCVVLGLKDLIHHGMYYLTCRIGLAKFSSPRLMMHDFIPLNFEDGLFKSDHLWLAYIPGSPFKDLSLSSRIEIIFSTHGNHRIIKNCGVRLVYTEDMSDDNATMIQHISAPQLSSVILEEISHSVAEDNGVKRSLDSGPGAQWKRLRIKE